MMMPDSTVARPVQSLPAPGSVGWGGPEGVATHAASSPCPKRNGLKYIVTVLGFESKLSFSKVNLFNHIVDTFSTLLHVYKKYDKSTVTHRQ